MQFEHGATLIPAINAGAWDQGIATRLVLFRDWIMKNSTVYDAHFDGLVNVNLDGDHASLSLSSSPRLKRKLDQTDFEVADSEDEDYGWEDDDELEMPSMPPQWQGSEDILLGQIEDDEVRTDETSEIQSLHPEGITTDLASDLAGDGGNNPS
ncbi:hypothetical protein AAE478_000557 [Parahypoxylon ruwenzoriense]